MENAGYGTWEDYFGIGWWSLKFSIPEWMRADLAIQGLLDDLKQSLKESALISLKLQETSKAAASRSQRHTYRFMVEVGFKRPRGGKGYEKEGYPLDDLSEEYLLILERKKELGEIRQIVAEKLSPAAWDEVWSWAQSNQESVPANVSAILEEICL